MILWISRDFNRFYGFQEIIEKTIITHSLSQNLNKDSYLFYFIFYGRAREREREGERERERERGK